MSANEISVRYKLATKTTAEWEAKSNVVPLKGEICFYSDTKQAKLGDGSTSLGSLEFLWLTEEQIAAMIQAAIDNSLDAFMENDLTPILNSKVPNTRTVNGKSLANDIELNSDDVGAIPMTMKGVGGGVAELDEHGYVPAHQLPSYVDDIVEGYLIGNAFYEDTAGEKIITPESSKIYVNISTTEYKAYRWAGTTAGYVEVFKSVTLGETSSTAYAGDKGKAVTDKVNQIIEGDIEVGKYTNDMPTVSAFGGIPAGTTFNEMPLSQLITKLLYPYIAPTVSVSSAPNNGGTFERGTTLNVTSITAKVTKKSESITRVEIFDGSTSLGYKTDGATGDIAFGVNVTVATTGKKFTAKVTDASGNTVSANSGTFTFVDPYYRGVLNDGDTFDSANMTKLIQSKGNKSVNYTAVNQKMVFAYPKSYGKLSKIIDPNQFDVTATWTCEEVEVTAVDGQTIAYYVYTSKLVTVDTYKMTFNY